MEYEFQYHDKNERESIIALNKDKYLIAEKNITEGNFLMFTTLKPIEVIIREQEEQLLEIQEFIVNKQYKNLLKEGGM